ncbi:hypothetical protein [Candidatus Nitrosocosmicus arcticus]|uniref:Uncharacterized protein n=1 Tax=Candidatus Nitrosocosmicus arcticus TaxID=2035267 RepID=A0A557SS52_9ARCH|nr:hypothetical protein [Candidatus Nitrosocosmicus arcticus]TVP39440.1 hypothetical protein NARC_150034 [Candidatus Nitrosocosmicus arcticus]
MNNYANCDPRTRAYKNGKTFEECKEEARGLVTKLSRETLDNEEISWSSILEIADHDEIVYKLILKYFREMGYDIGNYTKPRVVKHTS